MQSKYTVYALAAVAAMAFGFGVSFWRSAIENTRLKRENRVIEMAVLTAQNEVKDMREKLHRAVNGREFAEAAQTIAEASERAMREKLVRETSARQTADAGRQEAQNALKALTAKLAEESSARKSAEGALFTAVDQVRILSSKLAEVLAARETMEAGKLKAETGPNAAIENESTPVTRDEHVERGTDATPAKDQSPDRLASTAGEEPGENRVVNAVEAAQLALAAR